MKYSLNPRFQLHYNLLCKYDIIDKEFLNNFIDSSKLDFIKIIFTSNSSENQVFNILNKEFLTSQRINYQTKYRKSKLNFNKFTTTLRNSTLYIYLELFLHTYLLDKYTLFKINQKHFELYLLNKSFNLFFDKFLSNLTYCMFNNQNIFICLFLKNIKNINFKKQLNYYFIPT